MNHSNKPFRQILQVSRAVNVRLDGIINTADVDKTDKFVDKTNKFVDKTNTNVSTA
jgi:hypothetical protein